MCLTSAQLVTIYLCIVLTESFNGLGLHHKYVRTNRVLLHHTMHHFPDYSFRTACCLLPPLAVLANCALESLSRAQGFCVSAGVVFV